MSEEVKKYHSDFVCPGCLKHFNEDYTDRYYQPFEKMTYCGDCFRKIKAKEYSDKLKDLISRGIHVNEFNKKTFIID